MASPAEPHGNASCTQDALGLRLASGLVPSGARARHLAARSVPSARRLSVTAQVAVSAPLQQTGAQVRPGVPGPPSSKPLLPFLGAFQFKCPNCLLAEIN